MDIKITPPHYNTSIKRFITRLPVIACVFLWLKKIISALIWRDLFCRCARVINKGYGTYRKLVKGSNNSIIIGRETLLVDTMFHIIGHNNVIAIGDRCIIGKGCSFWMEGDNIQITIGTNTTFTSLCHLNAQENNSTISIGEDCMFSNHIIVRTSDSHAIYDLKTNNRINNSKSVVIGNHVWIAPDTKIMKGAIIGDGCIIGSNTLVFKTIPSNTLAVGQPARIIKENIRWSREDIIFKKAPE